jgi:hypothetical protein
MMFSSTTCRFVVSVLSLSLSATAETVRGVHRELETAKVELLTAENYAILSKTGISTVPNSVITGDIGVSPIAASAMTGFGLTLDATGTFSTCEQVGVGHATAASYGGAVATGLTAAVSDMEAAYTNAAGRLNGDGARINLGGGILGGAFGGEFTQLTTGIYTFGTDVKITGNVHFSGGATDVFIIQIAGSLLQDANINVILGTGVKAENIFWQVAKTVKVGAGAHMEGILLVKTAVTFETGSSLDGRVLSQTFVALDQATINSSASAIN